MKLPDLCFTHGYYRGDTVLLEPIARYFTDICEKVYIRSPYPELFDNHPSVIGLHTGDPLPLDIRTIDMNPSIKGLTSVYPSASLSPHKLEDMCKAAGVKKAALKSPQLFLSVEEATAAQRIKSQCAGMKVGVALETGIEAKNWPHMQNFIAKLAKSDVHIFVLAIDNDDGRFSWADQYSVYKVFDKSLREAMIYISAMDKMVGADTGLMHIAGALNVPSVVIGFDWFAELYELYNDCEYVGVPVLKEGMRTCKPRRILRLLKKKKTTTSEPIRANFHTAKSNIAIFRLDGLGGSLTMTDQAKKIHEMTGIKPDIITRGYRDLFVNNPHVGGITEVGQVVWEECLEQVVNQYDIVAEIRFALAKWHQKGRPMFHHDLDGMDDIFDNFPIESRQLEKYEKHHVQITDSVLGLPADTIDMEVFDYEPIDLPVSDYIVFANGVDAIYAGKRQTKSWQGWNGLAKLMDLPVIQIGLLHDPLINGVIDMRGRTSISQLCTLLADAKAVVCPEGGIMHLAYAVNSPHVFVPRGPTRGKLFEYPGQHYIDSYICDICWSSAGDWYMACPKGIDAACMRSITPERIAYNIQEVLNEDMVSDALLSAM